MTRSRYQVPGARWVVGPKVRISSYEPAPSAGSSTVDLRRASGRPRVQRTGAADARPFRRSVMGDHFEDSGVARDSEPVAGPPETPAAGSPAAQTPPGGAPTPPPPTGGATWVAPPSGPPEPIAAPPWPGGATDPGPTPTITPTSPVTSTYPSVVPVASYAPGGSGFTYSSPPPSGGGAAGGGSERPRLGRLWIIIVLVSALIGGAVGAIVTAATDNSNNGPPLTINEGSAAPGAALAAGKVSIPSLVNEVLPAVVSIEVTDSQEQDEGSGMIISSNGLVITNNHVIELASEDGAPITVTESGSTKAQKAALVGTDPSDDVALIRIDGASN